MEETKAPDSISWQRLSDLSKNIHALLVFHELIPPGGEGRAVSERLADALGKDCSANSIKVSGPLSPSVKYQVSGELFNLLCLMVGTMLIEAGLETYQYNEILSGIAVILEEELRTFGVVIGHSVVREVEFLRNLREQLNDQPPGWYGRHNGVRFEPAPLRLCERCGKLILGKHAGFTIVEHAGAPTGYRHQHCDEDSPDDPTAA